MLRILIAAVAALTMFGAARAAPPLAAYGDLPGIEMAALSPSGERLALVGAVGPDRRLVIIEGGRPVMTSPVSEQKVRRIAWAGFSLMAGSSAVAVSLG